jgi:hypothetical protein
MYDELFRRASASIHSSFGSGGAVALYSCQSGVQHERNVDSAGRDRLACACISIEEERFDFFLRPSGHLHARFCRLHGWLSAAIGPPFMHVCDDVRMLGFSVTEKTYTALVPRVVLLISIGYTYGEGG